MKTLRRFSILLLAFALTGCGRREQTPSVVVYASLDDVYARGLARLFMEQSGIDVQLVCDTEETKSTSILNRLIAEKARPRADVFLSNDPVRAAMLQMEGLAAAVAPGLGHDAPPVYFSARARVLIYNTNLVTAAAVPRSVREIAQPAWAAKSCMANPLFGTTAFHVAALFETWGEAATTNFLEAFARHGGTMLSSNGEVRRRVVAGQFAVGLTDSDDANVALSEGAPVGVVFPAGPDEGRLLVPCAAVLIRGAPNPEGGRKFAAFLGSPAAEEWMARSPAAQLPLGVGVAFVPEIFRGQADELRAFRLDYAAAGRRLREISAGYLLDWVSRQSR